MLSYVPITVLGAGWGIGFMTVYFNVDYDIAANAVAFMFMGAGFGSPIIAVLSELLKSRKIPMLIASVLAVLLHILLLYGDLKMSEYQLYLCLFLVGAFYSAKTLSFSVACDLVDKRISALTTSILNMTVMVSGLIFHPLIGFLLNNRHHEYAVYTKYDYKLAISVLPISAFIAFMLIIFVKDVKAKDIVTVDRQLFAIDE